jgi:rfaE bifunctional protein kinase chain/domain
MQHRLIPHVHALANHTVMVVGDVILDEYLTGTATRMSREAPIPVLEFDSRRLIPGGAANPAANIIAMGSKVYQIGITGSDERGQDLRRLLKHTGINSAGLLTDDTRPTTVKSRLMAQMGLRFPQQIARMDTLSRDPINPRLEEKLCAFIRQQASACSAILASDYHVGLLTSSLVDTLRTIGQQSGLVLAADAQGELAKYRGFTLVKCNADEARDYLRRQIRTNDEFAAAARELFSTLELTGGMVITRGADGATLVYDGGTVAHLPAPAVTDVFDTVGAGDTAIAIMTLAASARIPYPDAAMLANYASGLVVRKVGNYTPTPQELRHALETWTLNDHP